MLWRSKSKKSPDDDASPAGAKGIKQDDSEQSIAEALRNYQTQFYNKVKAAANDANAEEAKKIVARAKELVGSSGLGAALAPTLLEHVEHWPSWSERDDFYDFVKFPAQYIDGSFERDEQQHTETTLVTFSYRNAVYSLKFIDRGIFPWSDVMNAYGRVELISNGLTLLGLDIRQDLSKDDAARWRWSRVFAFRPGPWMKELVEMAAYIDGAKMRQLDEFLNEDAVNRASRIKLQRKSWNGGS